MKRLILIVFIAVVTSQLLHAQDLNNIRFTVTEAPEWTNLFNRTIGWFGGDGIYSIPLNGIESPVSKGQKTLFIFSDSMIGQVEQSKLQPGSKMIHNAAAILTGSAPDSAKINFFWKNNNGEPQALFTPKTPLTCPNDYYWLGDGFVNQELNNNIFIFGYRIKSTGSGAFGFAEIGNTLLKIQQTEKPPFYCYEQRDTPFYLDKGAGETGSFGAGILVNTKAAGAVKADGYIYVYGTLGKTKKLLVARVKPKAFENYSQWEYWDGKAWQADIQQAAALTDQVSNELSVSELPDGRYALVYQESGIGRNICMQLGASPHGPFGKVIKLWDTTNAITLKSFFTYNAKAHPGLSKKGELLISYNVNSFDFFKDLNTHPNLYRPRFIKVKFN